MVDFSEIRDAVSTASFRKVYQIKQFEDKEKEIKEKLISFLNHLRNFPVVPHRLEITARHILLKSSKDKAVAFEIYYDYIIPSTYDQDTKKHILSSIPEHKDNQENNQNNFLAPSAMSEVHSVISDFKFEINISDSENAYQRLVGDFFDTIQTEINLKNPKQIICKLIDPVLFKPSQTLFRYTLEEKILSERVQKPDETRNPLKEH